MRATIWGARDDSAQIRRPQDPGDTANLLGTRPCHRSGHDRDRGDVSDRFVRGRVSGPSASHGTFRTAAGTGTGLADRNARGGMGRDSHDLRAGASRIDERCGYYSFLSTSAFRAWSADRAEDHSEGRAGIYRHHADPGRWRDTLRHDAPSSACHHWLAVGDAGPGLDADGRLCWLGGVPHRA
jgi:hypothetical protein